MPQPRRTGKPAQGQGARKRKTKTLGERRRADLLVAVNESDVAANLAMAWQNSPPHYDVLRVDLSADVASQFLALARETAGQLVRSSVVPYDPEWPLKGHEHFELTRAEIPASDLFDDLQDLLNQPRLTRKLLTKPRVYVVAVQTSKGIALFGRRMAYLKVLGRQRSVFAAVWDGDTFDKLDKSVATFANTFDWIFWDGTLFVVDATGFHAEFRDNKAIKARVAEHVKTITKVLTIQNADAFVGRCQSSVPMASKLEKVANDGIWKESVEQLKKYATDYDIDVVWDGDDLVFEEEFESQWDILKLLDEDRTRGPVSGRHFESSAKRAV
jgi:hypothetical protein